MARLFGLSVLFHRLFFACCIPVTSSALGMHLWCMCYAARPVCVFWTSEIQCLTRRTPCWFSLAWFMLGTCAPAHLATVACTVNTTKMSACLLRVGMEHVLTVSMATHAPAQLDGQVTVHSEQFFSVFCAADLSLATSIKCSWSPWTLPLTISSSFVTTLIWCDNIALVPLPFSPLLCH